MQEESTALGRPCITLRENTERPVTIEVGSNELIGLDIQKALDYARRAATGKWKSSRVPELWDGKAASRIVQTLKETLV